MDEHDWKQEITHHRNPVRIINLTDAVFAIIMTLLVLEIKIPEELPRSVESTISVYGTQLISFIMSFALAAVYWMSHRLIFSNVKQIDTTLLWLNIVLLMIASLIPFVAGLLGSFPLEPSSLIFYAIVLTLLATVRLVMFIYVTSNKELLYSSIAVTIRSRIIIAMSAAVFSFFVSIFVASYYPRIAFLSCAFTPVLFMILVTKVSRPRSSP